LGDLFVDLLPLRGKVLGCRVQDLCCKMLHGRFSRRRFGGQVSELRQRPCIAFSSSLCRALVALRGDQCSLTRSLSIPGSSNAHVARAKKRRRHPPIGPCSESRNRNGAWQTPEAQRTGVSTIHRWIRKAPTNQSVSAYSRKTSGSSPSSSRSYSEIG
jgi:hypothetical protein